MSVLGSETLTATRVGLDTLPMGRPKDFFKNGIGFSYLGIGGWVDGWVY